MAPATFNAVLLGDHGVGKTALVLRTCTGYSLDDDYYHVSFRKAFRVIDQAVTVDFVPIPSHEEYQAMINTWISDGDGYAIVYSVTDRSSFESVRDNHELVLQLAKPLSPVVLIANKCDLKEQRLVSEEEGRALAGELGAEYREASAKDDLEGLNSIFRSLTTSMCLMRRCRVFFPDTIRKRSWKRALGLDRTLSLRAAKRWFEGPWS